MNAVAENRSAEFSRVAFIHIMKTGGSMVNRELTKVLPGKGYQVLNGRRSQGRDWHPEELEEFLGLPDRKIYVTNHVRNWPADLVEKYLANGWFVFAFYRHPGDQWCSFYHWSKEQATVKRPVANRFSLDEFLGHGWSSHPRRGNTYRENLDLPGYWQNLNWVANFSSDQLGPMIREIFDVEVSSLRPGNTSSNRGYEYYRQVGMISEETHRRLVDSKRYANYLKLKNADHQLGHGN